MTKRAAPKKKFELRAEDIKPIRGATGIGACFATDSITVGGNPVRFMYREEPDNDVDSGWRFFSGLESDAEANDPKKVEIYDVNTIANYDRSIVPYLHKPIGSVYEKPDGAKDFVRVTDWKP